MDESPPPAPCPKEAAPTLWGSLRGTVELPEGSELTEPTGEAWKAEG